MSMLLMVRAMQTTVGSPTRKLVLLKLADNANDQGECWPSYQYIADQCEMTKRSAMAHINALEKAGFLKRESRKGPKGNMTNVYHLTLKGSENISPPPSEKNDTPSENISPPSENISPPPSENISPGTSHSFEPVIEPKEIPLTPKGENSVGKEFLKSVMESFSEKLPSLTKPTHVTDARLRALKSRVLEDKTNRSTLSWWTGLFEFMAQSDFLAGRTSDDRGWAPDFDWILKSPNFVKILEGKYHG